MGESLKRIAARVSEVGDDFLSEKKEYSIKMEVSLSVEFEGDVSKSDLLASVKREIVASLESGITATARAFDLQPSNLKVKPLKIDVAVNDTIS